MLSGPLRLGVWVLSAIALGIGALALDVVPVRAYMGQRVAIAEAEDRLALLREGTAELEKRQAALATPAGIEAAARAEFGMVRPGDRAYVIVGLSPGDDALTTNGLAEAPPTPQALPDRLPLGQADLWARLIELLRSIAA
jgi:cell division protein FtsB